MLLGVYAAYWLLCVVAASWISHRRGYVATYGFLLGVLSVSIPLAGPALAVYATERWTRA